MATAKKSANKPASKTSSSHSTRSAEQQDAIALLTADHKEVKALFTKYDKLVKDDAEDDVKADLAEQICMMLTVHATVEEELFYPAAREAIDEPDLIDEADVEHATAKDLIAQIQAASLGEELYDAKVKVLGEYIAHHVKEEEGEIFPKVKKAKMDLKALGEEMSARKEELTSQMAAEIA